MFLLLLTGKLSAKSLSSSPSPTIPAAPRRLSGENGDEEVNGAGVEREGETVAGVEVRKAGLDPAPPAPPCGSVEAGDEESDVVIDDAALRAAWAAVSK